MGPDTERNARGGDPWIDRLSEYLDGDLKGAERAALESHVTACVTCAEALEGLRAVVSRARSLEDAPPAAKEAPFGVMRTEWLYEDGVGSDHLASCERVPAAFPKT